MSYIYLLIEREFINSNQSVYKVGKTNQPNYNRFKTYPNDSKILLHISVENCSEFEESILSIFRRTFIPRVDIGSEYFEGDVNLMRQKIMHIILSKEVSEKILAVNTIVDELSKHSFLEEIYLPEFSNEFVLDFAPLFNIESLINDDFIVNVRILAKWLEIKSTKNFYKNIRTTYTKDVDYILKQLKPGVYDMKITFECAKMVCNMSKSRKGKEIYNYFTKITKLQLKYQRHLINQYKDINKIITITPVD